MVENGTVVNLAEASAGNRFFVGIAVGGNTAVSTLNFAASSTAGTVYLQNTGNYGFRVGHQNNALHAGGIINIYDGVSFQSKANIWGQGTNTHMLNIYNGSLSFVRDMAGQSGSGGSTTGAAGLLHDMTVVLGMNGDLFIAGLNLADTNAFNTFLTSNGKSILMDSSLGAEYSLVYQNGASVTDAVSGASINGVRISVIPEPSTYAFASVLAAGFVLAAIRRRRN
ncbi:MAG: hypothetical protein LBV12_09080 [Puniceicoccales bacterium]|nr:hypothetical protein [Puniceicoccales bacterium]